MVLVYQFSSNGLDLVAVYLQIAFNPCTLLIKSNLTFLSYFYRTSIVLVHLYFFYRTSPSTQTRSGQSLRYIMSAVTLKVNNIPAYHLHGFSIILLSYFYRIYVTFDQYCSVVYIW